jgi:hypothetical protein
VRMISAGIFPQRRGGASRMSFVTGRNWMPANGIHHQQAAQKRSALLEAPVPCRSRVRQ